MKPRRGRRRGFLVEGIALKDTRRGQPVTVAVASSPNSYVTMAFQGLAGEDLMRGDVVTLRSVRRPWWAFWRKPEDRYYVA